MHSHALLVRGGMVSSVHTLLIITGRQLSAYQPIISQPDRIRYFAMYKEQLIILFHLLASRCYKYQLRVDDLLSIAIGLPHCNAVHGKKALLHGVQGYVDLMLQNM